MLPDPVDTLLKAQKLIIKLRGELAKLSAETQTLRNKVSELEIALQEAKTVKLAKEATKEEVTVEPKKKSTRKQIELVDEFVTDDK